MNTAKFFIKYCQCPSKSTIPRIVIRTIYGNRVIYKVIPEIMGKSDGKKKRV